MFAPSLSQTSSDQDKSYQAATVHAKISIFQSSLQSRSLRKTKMITRSLEDIVAGAKKADLAKLAKKWATNLEQFEVVRRSSSGSTAIAFASFNFGGAHGLSPQKIMALNKNARSCSRAYTRQRSSSSSSSQSSNNYSRPHRNYNRQTSSTRQKDMACYKCNRKGHFAMNCPRTSTMQTHTSPPARIPCHFCKKTGHPPKACWSNPNSPHFRPQTKKEA